jgi:LacI family transcriptional regulator
MEELNYVPNDLARKNGYRIIFCNSEEETEKEREYIDMCIPISVDGVVIAVFGDQSKQNLKRQRSSNFD